jgi:hypothetical protein
MLFLVFSQNGERLDVDSLVPHAARIGKAKLRVLSSDPNQTHLTLKAADGSYSGSFQVTTRAATEDDYARADLAEQAGNAAGMAQLARRCSGVWEVQATDTEDQSVEHAELAALNLSAVLAWAGLGPVMPNDGSTLYGVRGAKLRLQERLNSRAAVAS